MKSRTLLIIYALTSLLLVPSVTFAQEYQAEDAYLSSGFQVANDHSGYSGTGFVDYVGEGYVEWTVSVPSSGKYLLKFRYALASGNRPLNILINGSLASPNLAFPASGSWDKWVSANTEVSLNSGSNTVTAQTTGSSGANMDRLDVSAVAPPTSGRFIDNGDGTITDTETNLMWEKKLAADDEKCVYPAADVHCVDNQYDAIAWRSLFDENMEPLSRLNYIYPDGYAYTQFLATLNQQTLPASSDNVYAECFAKHCDWRIPTLAELRTILVYPCSEAPCIDPIFGPTLGDPQEGEFGSTGDPLFLSPYLTSTFNESGHYVWVVLVNEINSPDITIGLWPSNIDVDVGRPYNNTPPHVRAVRNVR